MASSGSFNTTAYDGKYLTFSWTLQSQDPAANTSTIAWTLKGAGGSGYHISGNFKVVIAGETVYSSATRIELYNGTTVATGTKVITHNTDGTKNFSASAEAGIYYVAVNCKGSGSWDLDSIPKTSTITCPSTAIGETARIAINRASTDFWHEITYEFGDLVGVCGSTGSSYLNWTIPDSFYDEMGNYTSKSCKLTCYTSIDGNLLGTSTTTFLVTIDADDSKPVLDVDVYDDNDTTVYLTGNKNTIIRYYSNIYYDMNNSYARNGAKIVSYKAKCGTTTKTAASDIFQRAYAGTLTFTITDNRGATVSEEVILPMINYIDIGCHLDVGNPTVSGNMTIAISGDYFNGSFGRMNNSMAVEYRYKEVNGSFTNWINAGTPTINGNSYRIETSVSGLDSTKTYIFEARAFDELSSDYSSADGVTSEPIFDWGANDFRFNVPVAANDDIIMPNGSYILAPVEEGEDPFEILDARGTSGNSYLNYSAYTNAVGTARYYGNKVHLRSKNNMNIEAGGTLDITSGGGTIYIGSWGDEIAIGGTTYPRMIYSGSWTPTVTGISASTATGYWMEIGETVILNWYIQGTVSSNQDYFKISTADLPYASDGQQWYSGGGNVSGGYTPANMAFSGWCLEKDGYIYARTVATGTTAGNRTSGYLQIKSGQTIYASGTLMYHIDPTALADAETFALRRDNDWLDKGELAALGEEEGNV